MKYNDKHWSEELMAYETGSQKADERYQLEKAALDDAFLFDALDGYTNHNQAQSDDAVQPSSAKQSASIFSMRNIAVAASLLLLVGIVGYMQQQQPADTATYAQVESAEDTAAPIAMTTPVPKAAPQQSVEEEASTVPAQKKAVVAPTANTEAPAPKRAVAEAEPKKEKVQVVKKEQKLSIDGIAVAEEAAAQELDERPTALSQGDNAIAGLAMPKKSQSEMSLADGGNVATEVNVHKDKVTPPAGWSNFDTAIKSAAAKLSQKQIRPVVVSFMIAADGTVSNVRAIKTDCIACADRAVQLIKRSGKWTNSTGKPYAMQYRMRI